MPTLEEFCRIDAKLDFQPVGKVPAGMRIDVPFDGTAASSHWEGERPVQGVDYVTVRGDGNMSLDIRGRIGSGKEVVAYRALGVSMVGEGNVAEPQELVLFETANEKLAYLNTSVGIALGRGEKGRLQLTLYLVRP